jgi:Pyridine nucleotide-disulphide oxidoreductase
MNFAPRRDDCEVVVIGAGPYGLAVAAHLKAAGVATRAFGQSMSAWRDHMPKGMKLQSPSAASHLADPEGKYSLDAFAHQLGNAPAQDQLPLEHFVRYGEWFQRQTVHDLDSRKVTRIEQAGKAFCLVLDNGEAIHAPRIVIAMGLTGQEFRPAEFDGLPSYLVSHASEHASLEAWRGQRVAVVGRGQSACESAALLREAGSEVDIICRGNIRWGGPPASDTPSGGGWLRATRAPSAVGPHPLSLLNELPGAEHLLPAGVLAWINSRSLRPTPAWWLKPRLDGVRVLAGRRVAAVTAKDDRVSVELDDRTEVYHHVLLATGYKIDIAKLRILPPELLRRIACIDGAPSLADGFESTVPRLHFVGASSVASFGPLMRFIAGAGYAARSITRTHMAQTARAKLATLNLMDCDFLTSPAEDIVRR